MAVKWVVMSDLHLGADQSVLTDGLAPSATASAFASCLRELFDGDRPTLVLAGDAIELALQQMPDAFTVFEGFLDLVHGSDPIIGDRIVYLPGNHDHHLWQVSRQHGYMRAIAETGADDPLPRMWFTSGLDPDQDLPLSPLVALMRRNPRWDGLFVDAVYPNLALVVPGQDRRVVIHHGHLIEPIYTAMSRIKALVFPAAPPTTVEQIELENNAWIDFLWSELGRSGGVGTDLHTAYHLLPDARSVRHVTDQVAERLADRWTRWPIPARIRRRLLRTVLDDLVAGSQVLETHHTGVLSPSAEAGLHSYLRGPVARQLGGAGTADAFIFGHTHKPYQQLVDVDGTSVAVYNTGGWVNETAEVQTTQGAQLVLVDDELNVVALELYRQRADDTRFRVRLRQPLVDDDGHRRFHELLDQRIRPDAEPWTTFSSTVAARLRACRADLAELYARNR